MNNKQQIKEEIKKVSKSQHLYYYFVIKSLVLASIVGTAAMVCSNYLFGAITFPDFVFYFIAIPWSAGYFAGSEYLTSKYYRQFAYNILGALVFFLMKITVGPIIGIGLLNNLYANYVKLSEYKKQLIFALNND